MISLPWPKERKTLKLQKNIVAKAIKHKNCIKLLKYVQGIVKVSFFIILIFFTFCYFTIAKTNECNVRSIYECVVKMNEQKKSFPLFISEQVTLVLSLVLFCLYFCYFLFPA